MKMQNSNTCTMVRTVMMVCSVLASGSFAVAQTPTGACTDRILHGDYGVSIEGVLVPPAPNGTIALRGVAMMTFRGDGTLSQVDHVVIPGVPLALEWTPGTGTYHVNPDCTGSAHIDIQTAPGAPQEFTNLSFVVVSNGKEIHMVVSAPFDLGGLERTVTSVAVRRDN